MGEVHDVRVLPGTRAGIWRPGEPGGPFIQKGTWIGPELKGRAGEPIVGEKFDQELMEGTIKFSVGVLFRPDRSKKQSLEPILILDSYFEEIWNYDTWEELEPGDALPSHG